MADDPRSGPWPAVELLPPSAWEVDRPAAPDAGYLLNEARACEPAQLLTRRTTALDEATTVADPPRELEVRAERALDAARTNLLDEAEDLARAVLDAGPGPVAWARATEALGRVQVWRGDTVGAAEGAESLTAAAEAYAEIGSREWEGQVRFWLANTVHLQRGDLVGAERLMRAALDLLAPTSSRRAGILTFLADVLEALGRWDDVDAVLDEAAGLVVDVDLRARAYVAWARARGAAARRDAVQLARYLGEVERNVGDWFDITTGATFLGDAAVLAARVGDRAAASGYLRRAVERDPDDEFVLMAEAELLARFGDPEQALVALRALGHARWLEVRQVWRLDLLTAWATVRAGHGDVGAVAARGLQRAHDMHPAVAPTGEPELVRLLARIAARHGSRLAARLLAPSGVVIVLLGDVAMTRDGAPVAVPSGIPGALLRLVASHHDGVDAERAVDVLWPDADLATGRRSLRDALSRLRTRVGDVVVRDGSRLLVDAWVDLPAFRAGADEALAHGRDDGLVLAALALWGGTPLPADPYADWAREVREPLRRRHVRLLDLAADLVPGRAATFLERAVEADPQDVARYDRLAEHYDAQGRPAVAERWRRQARDHG